MPVPKPNPLDATLNRQGFVVLDGAMGTELERRGADLNDPLWSGRILRDEPEQIRQVHEAHLQAGADIVLTASYQIGDDQHLLARSVEVAKAAVAAHNRPALVAGSLGPYGACLADGSEYSGEYGVSHEVLVAFHRQRLGPLVEAGADLLAFETIPSLQEAEAIGAVLKDAAWAGVSAWVSFSCRDGQHVSHGEAFVDCIGVFQSLKNVVAVGVNCTAPQHVVGLLESAKGQSDKHLVAYPNRGAAWDGVDKKWSCVADTRRFADWAGAYFETGARLIGGCCQTTPEDIRRIREVLVVQSNPHR